MKHTIAPHYRNSDFQQVNEKLQTDWDLSREPKLRDQTGHEQKTLKQTIQPATSLRRVKTNILLLLFYILNTVNYQRACLFSKPDSKLIGLPVSKHLS